MPPRAAFLRLPFVVASLLMLLIGMWGGLLRLGWIDTRSVSVPYHGPLMICGFLGTLISLERAVALARPWAYAAPLASALGAIVFLIGWPLAIAQSFFILAAAILSAVLIRIFKQQPTVFIAVMTLGALAWLGGNFTWLHSLFVPPAVTWWMAFLVLTIVGERLELSRFLPHSDLRLPTFIGVTAIYLAGIGLSIWIPGAGLAITGLGQLALAEWLVTFDLARQTARQCGLTRYTALCLLSGYLWLAIGGLISFYFGAVAPLFHDPDAWLLAAPTAGLAYDCLVLSWP
jgi:hypothetical protein